MENTKIKQNIFNANYGQSTAIGRKERAESYIDKCDYCEGTGKDIFDKENVCPFCYGSLKIAYNKEGEKIVSI